MLQWKNNYFFPKSSNSGFNAQKNIFSSKGKVWWIFAAKVEKYHHNFLCGPLCWGDIFLTTSYGLFFQSSLHIWKTFLGFLNYFVNFNFTYIYKTSKVCHSHYKLHYYMLELCVQLPCTASDTCLLNCGCSSCCILIPFYS